MKKLICIILAMLLGTSAMAADLLDKNFAILQALDIQVPDAAKAAIAEQIDSIYETMPEELRLQLGYSRDSFSEMTDVLAMLGYGDYDPETWAYIPYTDDVYAFDAEMFDIQQSYTDLLLAVARMSRGEVALENVEIQISDEPFESGTGSLPIAFCLNGQDYNYAAAFEYDWMDVGIIDFLNTVLEEQGMEARIWSMYDLGQGLILFYRDEAWAERFMAATGCELSLGTGAEQEAEGLFGGLLDAFF